MALSRVPLSAKAQHFPVFVCEHEAHLQKAKRCAKEKNNFPYNH